MRPPPPSLSGHPYERYAHAHVAHSGPLSQIKWFRVVLDEAQFIRNRSTRCSKAVAMLRTKYRWCLTGTPITNTLCVVYVAFWHGGRTA